MQSEEQVRAESGFSTEAEREEWQQLQTFDTQAIISETRRSNFTFCYEESLWPYKLSLLVCVCTG